MSILARLKRALFLPAVSEHMSDYGANNRSEDALRLWYDMFVNTPPWASERVRPLGLPAAICRELARPALLEFQCEITGGARADFLQRCFDRAREDFLPALTLGLALGGVAWKPCIEDGRLLVDATGAAAFSPTGFDAAGNCTGGVFHEKPLQADGKWYVRLEEHEFSGGTCFVRNRAFRSDAAGNLFDEVSLGAVPAWAGLEPEIAVAPADGPLFAYFRTPVGGGSGEPGVSLYGGAAVELIRQADEQWELLRWEYDSGRRKIYMDGTAATAGQFDRDLFELGMFSSGGDFFHEFSPEFRDEALYRGLQAILRQIEFQTGLSYGTISDPLSVDRTATEVRSSKQRMFVTVAGVQRALEPAFNRLIAAMDVYASLYGLAPEGKYSVRYEWGDGVLGEIETE